MSLSPTFKHWFNFVAHVVNSTELKKGREKELLGENREARGGWQESVWR
jgi:hypothetical protein